MFDSNDQEVIAWLKEKGNRSEVLTETTKLYMEHAEAQKLLFEALVETAYISAELLEDINLPEAFTETQLQLYLENLDMIVDLASKTSDSLTKAVELISAFTETETPSEWPQGARQIFAFFFLTIAELSMISISLKYRVIELRGRLKFMLDREPSITKNAYILNFATIEITQEQIDGTQEAYDLNLQMVNSLTQLLENAHQ